MYMRRLLIAKLSFRYEDKPLLLQNNDISTGCNAARQRQHILVDERQRKDRLQRRALTVI
jgi:hypothetical protein